MLPLSLKVVWLVFAFFGMSLIILIAITVLTHTHPSPRKGIPATWFVFIPFASAIQTYWAPILYCITITVLEITFCLGTLASPCSSFLTSTFP
jgi:hypothetical protein